MTRDEFRKVIKQFRDEQDRIMFEKNKEYTRGEDNVIANFQRSGEAVGIRIEQAWGNMFAKQVDAILHWVKTGSSPSEGIESRLIDAANFLLLGLPVLEEMRHGETLTPLQYRDNARSAT